MGEIRDLIGIHGAIDRAVADDPERRAAVSRLLPVYRDPDVRWFDDDRIHQALGDLPPAEFEALSTRRDETITPTMIKLETT